MPAQTKENDTAPSGITQQAEVIACVPAAIPAAARDAHFARAARLLHDAYEEHRELSDGYAWRFAADEYDELAAYVADERRCCPFFTFTLEVTPAGGPVWLRITGTDAVKAFLRAELASNPTQGDRLSPNLTR